MRILKKKISFKVFIPIYLVAYYCCLILLKENRYYQQIVSSMFNLCGFIITIFYLYYTYKSTKDYRKHYWLLLALSILCYTIADCIWFYYENILKVEICVPSIIDVFYLLRYPLTILGILYLIIKSNNKVAGVRLFFDTLILIIMGGTMIFSFYHPRVVSSMQFNASQLFMLIAYPVGDLVLLFNIAYLSILSQEVLPKYVVLAGASGFFVDIIMDIVFLHVVIYGKIDFIYYEPIMISALLILALSGELFLNKKTNDEGVGSKKTNLIVLLVPYVIVFIIIIVILLKFSKIDFLARGLVITMLLIITRQVLTIVENQNLLKLLMNSNSELKLKKLELEKANSELRKFYLKKEQESKTDFLTGLYNRRYIDENFVDYRLLKNKMSALMVDIDHFKLINDTYGHDVGDIVLKNLSKVMKKNTRADDVLIRFGGEEFVCFLPNTDMEVAKVIAERLRREIENCKFIVNNEEIKITVSIGVSNINSIKNKQDIDDIIVEADKALYKAKRTGRNKVVHM